MEYFISLVELPLPQLAGFDKSKFEALRDCYRNFDEAGAEKVKKTERTTNHDVKAVEYYLKDVFDEIGISEYTEFIHFGLTSQDVNNTAIPLSLKDALTQIYHSQLDDATRALESLSLIHISEPTRLV